MMRVLLCFAAVLGYATSLFAARAPEIQGPRSGKWAHEMPRAVAPDATVRWGRLENGFRYALLPHKGVPGRVTLQLLVLAGSIDERPTELGIAHYIEHLAFGGSKNFKAQDMVSLFQRLGVEYGSDVNAITTFDYTAFRLDFRENDAKLMDEGLRLFRDFGDGVTFEPRAIEQERRVVLAELRNRNTISGKKQEASLPVIFRGMQFPQRGPGGSEGQIAKFTREQFLEFYRRNYRSDLMVLVGAGDFDPATMEAMVKVTFASMVRPKEPIPAREEGRLDARSLRAGVLRVGVGSAMIEAASVAPYSPKADSRELQIERQKREFVMGVFDERLRTQMDEGFGGEAGYDELLGYGVAIASTRTGAKEWADGAKALDQMVRLSLERGLDPSDIAEHRKRKLKLATHMIDQLPTVDPAMLCEALTESIAEHAVYPGFATKFAWERDWLERFTPQEAQQVFRNLWKPGEMAFYVAGGVDMELTGDKVVTEINKGRRNGLANVMPRQHRDTPFRLPKLAATPTAVAESRDLPSLGAKLMRFGNNVRFNFVPNKQEPGIVQATVRVGNGLLDMPGNKPALKEFGLNMLLGGGAVHYRPEQLNALIDERLLGFSFDIADRDAFTFRGTMAAEQLDVFLGIVADFLNAPQFNSYVYREQRLLAVVGRMSQTMGMGEGMRALTDHLFKGDARFTWGSPKDYLSMSVLDVKRWMEPALSRGYVEVTLVGDIPEATAVASMTNTLGSLKPRAATKTSEMPPKPVTMTAEAGFKRIEFIGEQNMGLVIGAWPLKKDLRVRDQAALELLAKILEIRVRTELRENLGLAYSPSAQFQPYDGFSGFSMLRAQVDCAPNDTMRVGPLLEKIGADLAKAGVQEGEFIGARGILKSQLKQAFRDNSFLVSVLMRAQERPEEVQEIVELKAGAMDNLTLEDVNTFAREILVAGNCRTAAIVPKAFVGLFDVK